MAKKYVKMGVQTNLTTAAATLSPVAATEVNITGEHNMIFLEAIDADMPYAAVMGNYIARDSLGGYAVKDQIDILLEAAMGAKADNATSTGYVYTLDIPKPLTVEVGDEHGDAYQIVGMLLNRLELTFDVRDVVKFSGDYVARTINVATHDYTALPTSILPFICWNTTITVDATTLKARELTFSIERNIREEDGYILGDRFLDAIIRGAANIGGRCTLIGSEVDEFRRAIFGSSTATSPQNTPAAADMTITSLTPDGAYKMVITVSNAAVYYRGTSRVSGSDPTAKSFEWRAVGDDSVSIEIASV